MALTDILNKLGGQNGEQGGLAAISKLFEGEGMQGILGKLQASGLDKQVMSWIGHGQNEPVTGDDIKNAVDPQQLSQVAQQTGMSQGRGRRSRRPGPAGGGRQGDSRWRGAPAGLQHGLPDGDVQEVRATGSAVGR